MKEEVFYRKSEAEDMLRKMFPYEIGVLSLDDEHTEAFRQLSKKFGAVAGVCENCDIPDDDDDDERIPEFTYTIDNPDAAWAVVEYVRVKNAEDAVWAKLVWP